MRYSTINSVTLILVLCIFQIALSPTYAAPWTFTLHAGPSLHGRNGGIPASGGPAEVSLGAFFNDRFWISGDLALSWATKDDIDYSFFNADATFRAILTDPKRFARLVVGGGVGVVSVRISDSFSREEAHWEDRGDAFTIKGLAGGEFGGTMHMGFAEIGARLALDEPFALSLEQRRREWNELFVTGGYHLRL